MDNALSKLLSFPPHPPPPNPLTDHQYDEKIKEQIEAIKGLPTQTLLQTTSGGEHALDVINPAINTIPYSFVLLANISTYSDASERVHMKKIWEKIKGYLYLFDPRQVRYIGSEFNVIIETALNYAQEINQPDLAIIPLKEAITRLDPTGAVLTSNHLRLVKLVLETHHYEAMDSFLDQFILYVPDSNKLPNQKYLCAMTLNPSTYITSISGLTKKLNYLDILEYFIFCGMICLGTRKWSSALRHFECAITYPVRDAISKPMLEAYKKWVLTGVILHGKLLPLPKITSSIAAKAYHALAMPYESLAHTFENDTASRLKSDAQLSEQLWATDCNSGLVFEVLASYQKIQIRNLANVYCKLSLPEIHSQTTCARLDSDNLSVNDTEELVLSMISQGELLATISKSPSNPSILTFSPVGPVLSEQQVHQELIATKSRIQYISQEIKITDRNLIHNKEYIKFLQKEKRNIKQEDSDNETQAVENNMNWNDIDELDEDIMGVF
ncbi:putative cop9 signalosome complex subunit 3 [Erysiphe necator]|uniref:Putative cop9 signalosome complex subunit 3 n=1 Tax=Uncinula necator TaxID=52586 RepID=A0A0B1PG36_UNCNE|nr:putative cop9 signalosome complex subunit 3 [Erysiphe necator]